MRHTFRTLIATLVALFGMATANQASAQFAAEVVSYDQGTGVATEFGTGNPFNHTSAALGAPETITGVGTGFPNVVSPFSPPYQLDQVVSVGEGGHITLRLANEVLPQAGGPELGVFTNAGFADANWPSGQVRNPPFAFGANSADVEVSDDGSTWVSLGNNLFDIPSNAYTDLSDPYASSPGSALADPHLPFTGTRSDFVNLFYDVPLGNDVLSILDGSAGGTWLDISSTGLSQVSYIRFSVPSDNDPSNDLSHNFELDAVSIATDAVGPATVPEPSAAALALLLFTTAWLARRKR